MTAEVVRLAPLSDKWRQLAEQLAPGASRFELEYAGEVCQRLDLSMFTNPPQVVLFSRWDKRVGRDVYRPQVTVDGRLALAVRAGRVLGLEGPQFTGPREGWTDLHGARVWIDLWDCKDEGAYPRAARYLIHVDGWSVPVNGTAPWLEFAQRDRQGKLLPLWARMPTTMLAKTALSLGLRRSGVENLPADVAVAYEGDPDHDPAPAGGRTLPVLSVPHGRGGPVATLDQAVADYSSEEILAAYERRRRGENEPPVEVYDDQPESRGYDEDLQPASYADPALEDDGRPFEEGEP